MRHLFFCIYFFVFSYGVSLSQVNPYGQPFIKNYSLKDYNAKSQNWAIAKDARGVMYFANNDGVLEYDGHNWELIRINKGAIVRSIAIDSTGTIYVGAENEFGYIQANELGKLYYSSLSDSLKADDQGFLNINKVYVTPKGVLFCSQKKIFRYHQGYISNINLPKGGFLSHIANKNIYMGDYWEGLMVLDTEKFVPCKGGDYYAEKDIFSVIPYKKNQLLIATSKHGLFIYNPITGQSTAPNYSAYKNLHKFITDSYLYSAFAHNDGFRFNTLYGGTVITDSIFIVKEAYNKSGGLQDEVILGDFIASERFASAPLWLSLNNGISKVETNSPFRIFDEKSGLHDEVLDIISFNGTMYFATINGVYKLFTLNELPVFEKLEGTEGECWSMVEFNGYLLIGGGYNLFIHSGVKTRRIETDDLVYKLYLSKKYPNRIYIGENKGLSIYSFDKGKFSRLSKLSNITERVSGITEGKEGNLWLKIGNNELLRVSLSKTDTIITRFNDSLGFVPTESLQILNFGDKIYFSTHKSLLQFCNESNRIIPAANLDSIFNNEAIWVKRYTEDFKGNVWLVSSKSGSNAISLLKNRGNSLFIADNTPYKRLPTCIINAIYPDNNGIAWIGTSEGLYTFNTQTQVKHNEPFNALIRKVYIGEDSVLFHGTFIGNGIIIPNQPTDNIPILRYRNNGLTFHYSSSFFIEENETKYSFFLEGFDSESSGWSNWTKETKKEYTNLREGDYTFKVKALNIFGVESTVAEYAFKIQPPWYRTYFAFIFYIILLSIFIWIIVKFNVRRLQLEKVKLEGIVKERTTEIRHQRDEIEKQKDEITGSIRYAKRIQNAVLPPDELISVLLPDHFILFKPRDIVSGDFYWMKQLGDYTLLAAADCTGHGVPGAFMSMLGIAFLNEIALNKDRFVANEFLNELRNKVKQSLRQTGKQGEAKDGMDIALCVINRKKMKLHYAGAYNPLYLFRLKTLPNPIDSNCFIESESHNLYEIKADKMPIGIHIAEKNSFTNHEIDLQPGDTLYIFSDGFVDQTGGEMNRKFMTKNFKSLLFSIQHETMEKQRDILDKTIENWKGTEGQVDDILIIGVKF
jgi:serine phosphatase RsbU (regulator of sigma subunit)/ligand-binding sensor domain-containing protein